MVYPKLINATPIAPLTLELIYDNGEKRIIVLKRYCITDYFKQLEQWNYFIRVKVQRNVVVWPNEQDIAPETLYLDSTAVN